MSDTAVDTSFMEGAMRARGISCFVVGASSVIGRCHRECSAFSGKAIRPPLLLLAG